MDAETAAKLKQYEDQLGQVRSLLTSQPDNVELRKLEQDLSEVIRMTQELEQKSAAPPPAAASGSGGSSASAARASGGSGGAAGAAGAAGAGLKAVAGPAVVHQGQCCDALFDDGTGDKWYPAWTKEADNDAGAWTVVFLGFGNEVRSVCLGAERGWGGHDGRQGRGPSARGVR
jgi:hypothetical protein